MIKFDLQKIEDLALVGVLLSKEIYPVQGCNYITKEGKREQYAYFDNNAKDALERAEEAAEFKAAYLMAVFIDEARKQVPLVVHTLSNNKEIMVPADMQRSELINLMNRI